MENPKYKEKPKDYQMPDGKNHRIENSDCIKIVKKLHKVLKSNRFKLKAYTEIENLYFNKYVSASRVVQAIKLYYDEELILDFPKGCFGRVYKSYSEYNKKDMQHTVGDRNNLFILNYINSYMNTPLNRIQLLPAGPLGIFEILMAMDERISIKRLESIQFMMESSEARKIVELRKNKYKKG